jgi:hypothetical protein
MWYYKLTFFTPFVGGLVGFTIVRLNFHVIFLHSPIILFHILLGKLLIFILLVIRLIFLRR